MLKGRHRQVVDAYDANSGFPLAFAYTFVAPNAGAATAVIVLRHGAFPIALGSEMWENTKSGRRSRSSIRRPRRRRSRIRSYTEAWRASG